MALIGQTSSSIPALPVVALLAFASIDSGAEDNLISQEVTVMHVIVLET